MDALSDVLKTIRVEGAIYLDAEFTAPWCINARYGFSHVRERLPHADHVTYFHFLLEGRCQVQLFDGIEPIDARAGDLILFASDEKHLMGSDLTCGPSYADELAGDVTASMLALRAGGGGEATRFVCSYLACSRAVYRPLLSALPRVLCVNVGDGPAASAVRELLRVGVRESAANRPGADSMRMKLAELLFVEAMRRYVESLPPEGRGWLAGVRDPYVGRTLALLHADPAKAWTVDDLARDVALSRSALAERFTALVGESPIQYLVRWRLALAAQSLRTSRDPLVRIAERAGYESEAAFNRAFKREFGMPPATWRRSQLVAAS